MVKVVEAMIAMSSPLCTMLLAAESVTEFSDERRVGVTEAREDRPIEPVAPVGLGGDPQALETDGHKRYGISVVPPPVHAGLGTLDPSKERIYSPGSLPDLLGIAGKDVIFWRPTIMDIMRSLGWGWLLMLPALTLIFSPLLVLLFWGAQSPFLAMSIGMWKLWILALGVVISLIAWSMRRAVKGRNKPFCIHCGYDLDSAPREGICPECGRRYVPDLWQEYRKDPAFFVRRYRQLGKHPVGVSVEVNVPVPPRA
jgi:hypothetical protein